MAVKIKDRTLEEKILLGITAAATCILFPFLITSILSRDISHIIVDFIAVGGIFSIFLGVWFTRRVKLFIALFAVLAHVNILIGIYLKGAGLMYWLFPIIIGSFYLLPIMFAVSFNFLLVAIGCYFTYNQFDSFTLSRLIASFIVTNIFSFIFSVLMKNQNKKLLEQDKINTLRNHILELIASSSPLPKILTAITHAIENEFPGAICSILLVDEKDKKLKIGAAPNLPDFYITALSHLKIAQGEGSSGTAAYTGNRVIVNDIATHPYWVNWQELAKQANLAACWAEPIINNDNEVLGTFSIYHHQKSTPTDTEFELIEQFANLARIAIERKKADQIIWQQANYDNLTKLPNRNLLQEHLSSAIAKTQRERKQLAIAMLDLDNFKQINDTLGHGAGDNVLIESAKRIQNCIRKSDIAARLGGDEFIIILHGTTTPEDIKNIGEKLSNALAKPYFIEEKKVYCTASIGIAFYDEDAQSIDTLLKNADNSMYRAKMNGRNRIDIFKNDLQSQSPIDS